MSKALDKPAASLLRLASTLLNSPLVELLSIAVKYGSRVWSQRVHEGLYEVLDFQSTLELKDTQGHNAHLYKRQSVKFLQNNIIAYQDQAWGDGDIFAVYKCSPGQPVDCYRDGQRYRILISLRGTKNRGDEEEFHIERTITEGFTQETEDFQTDIDHTTRKLSLSIIFPAKRLPKKIVVIEKNTAYTHVLDAAHQHRLPDQRLQVRWTSARPKLFEAYIMRWEW